MSKAVLVPTDFSDNAAAAARYAAQMARHFGWSIHLLHLYTPFSTAFGGEELNREAQELAANEAESNMTAAAADLEEEFSGVVITTDCKQGVMSDVVYRTAREAKNNLIVMGTKGASGLKHAVLGSNTFEIIKNSPIPVLAVPETPPTFQQRNVGLLTNFQPSEIEALEAFIAIGEAPQQVTLIHLFEKGANKDERDLADWAKHIQDRTAISRVLDKTAPFSDRMDVKEDFPEHVFRLAQSDGMDLLIVSRERKGFFDKLFSGDRVKAMAHQLEIPIFFHNA
ncbi:universal stress protein [Parapedobacter sp. ISTM3]|uniref:universal stress protein n=1 Tax=Parapedobacter sp. ISTM3 TaxID=2800130 RepID=UPI001904ABD3|nr:universal stress protein [Parapedobacter sp. ISTM3]MBK1441075.1 universal stress protein [Parapedobacter sp. ISTM3]